VSVTPRILTNDTYLVWDNGTSFVKKGTMVGVAPGSALETAYGGSGNLRTLTAGELGNPECSDRSIQHN
jgi:hypothetical protein